MARRDSPTVLLAVLGAALTAGALVVWLALGDGGAVEPASVEAAPTDVARTTERSSTAAPALPVEPARAEESAADTDVSSAEPRAEVSTQAERELADGLWVEGVVHFPDAMPTGEEVEVVAGGRKFEHRDLHRARIAADGRFRVAFAKDTKTGYLKVDAPHVYLEPPLKVKPSAPQKDVVLETSLGGLIEGVIVPPPGVVDCAALLKGKLVTLSAWSDPGGMVQRTSPLDEQLHFALRGVPADLDCSVSFDPAVWVAVAVPDLKLKPGETRALELKFTRGARIAGRIVDDKGAGVAGVALVANCERDEDAPGWQPPRQAKVEADGTFLIEGVAPGKVTLNGTKQGWLDGELELGQLADGEEKLAVEVRLSEGHVVAGAVKWPDGRPAVGAWVRVEEPKDGEDSGFDFNPFESNAVKTATDGSFRITGLGGGPFVVQAQAKSELEPAAPAPAPGEPKKIRKKGPPWHVRAAGVAADTAGLELVLQEGLAASGLVVDENGAPVKRFNVRAVRHTGEESWFAGLGQDTVSQVFDSRDGSFELEGLREGEWKLTAIALGFDCTEAPVVRVPQSGAPVVVRLARVVRLSGVVLDATGAPASKAVVDVDSQTRSDTILSLGDRNATTGADGRFELKNVPAGKLTLQAKRPGNAASDKLELDVPPGAVLADLKLSLRRGGRVTGELLAGRGGGRAGRDISLSGEGEWERTQTDAQGRFEFSGLTPGKYELAADPSEEAQKQLLQGQDERSWELMQSLRETASVEVADGETVHVVLGAPSRTAVLVSGVVRRGTKPVDGAVISAFPHTEEGRSRSAVSDAAGRYELALDAPGPCNFSVRSSSGGTQTSRQVTVPSGAAFALDFELPAGRIRGRVLDSEGAPLKGAMVQLSIERAEAERRSDGVHGWMRSGDDGGFAFEDLPAATYTLTASDMETWRRRKSDVEHAPATRKGLVLAEGGALEGLELKLERGGALAGTVRTSAGEVVSDATVRVYGSDGQPHEVRGSSDTDSAGHYRVSGLPPGRWSVAARRGDEVSEVSAPVLVSADGEAQVDLTLHLGGRLHVVVEDADGKLVGASISIRDARGVEHGDEVDWERDQESGAETQGYVFGPFAPGSYRVTATNHDGASASDDVHLSSNELTVRLKLGKP